MCVTLTSDLSSKSLISKRYYKFNDNIVTAVTVWETSALELPKNPQLEFRPSKGKMISATSTRIPSYWMAICRIYDLVQKLLSQPYFLCGKPTRYTDIQTNMRTHSYQVWVMVRWCTLCKYEPIRFVRGATMQSVASRWRHTARIFLWRRPSVRILIRF